MFDPVASTLAIARAAKSRINAFGYDLTQDGKNGHSARLAWTCDQVHGRISESE